MTLLGLVYFGVGDGLEKISVKLLANYSWSAILDFQVEFVAYTAVNASIAQYSSKTWVKIVDKDVSSSNELLIAHPWELCSSE